ncbi:MAG: efflux transporter outer membrane subunit [Novosphingobium sp.]|nr:efflux transporter outer membrane subunit [Novosphingobium sp.]
MLSANRTPSLLLCAALTLAGGLGGCAAIPDLGPKPIPRAASDVAAERSFAGAGESWPDDRWWTGYGDPQLDALIEEGLRNSPDMAAAAARFRKAVGYARQAGAPLLPSLDANGAVAVNKQSYNNGFPKEFVPHGWLDTGDLSVSLGFDLDIWGRNRAALAAATSDVKAARYDTRQAQLALATGIADAYADLARLYEERDIQQATLDIRLASQKLVAERQRNGLETKGSVKQADANVSTARAALAAAQEAIALRSNQIAALVGAGPDRGLELQRPRLSAPAMRGLPADVTTELVVRRPDVAAALVRVEAAASRIRVARADFFPAIRLDALIGYQALGLDQLIEKDSVYGNAGPAISLPIFHGGAIGGQYRSARATYDEAVADYDKAVLAAYQQVADAVTSRSMLGQRLKDAREALTASQQALDIARLRYEGGLSSYIDVLNVEDRMLTAREAVAELEARAFTLDIALVRSLGGGFPPSDISDSKEDTNG